MTSKSFADEQHFTIARGDDKVVQFVARSNGSITGQTAVFTARRRIASANPADLSVTATILDAGSPSTLGIWGVPLTRALTLALETGVYPHALNRTDSNAASLIAKGNMTVIANIQDPV